ncbi:MAG TPA: hypothetical protein VIM73_14085 [Polyangiaceae bacterium]
MVQSARALRRLERLSTLHHCPNSVRGGARGVETSPALVARFGDVLHALDRVVLAIFVLEIVVKVAA